MTELGRLLEMLSIVERESGTGVTRIDFLDSAEGPVIGRIAADGARICWAACPEQTPRISDIFGEECGVSRDQLEEAFEAATEKEIPFGEELVSRKLIREEDLRRCLRRQMTTALLHLSSVWTGGGPEQGYSVSGREDSSYDPAFMASTLDLLIDCIDLSEDLRRQAGSPSSEYTGLAPQLPGAVCLRRSAVDGFEFLPLACADLPGLSIVSATALARSGLGVASPPALRAAGVVPHAVLMHGGGRGYVCTQDDPFVCIYEVSSREQYGVVLAHIMARLRATSAT